MSWLLPIRVVASSVVVGVLCVGAVQLAHTSGQQEGDLAQGPRAAGARVLKVVDGDTVHVRLDAGRTVTVRLLGINSPEMPHECFAAAATHGLEVLVPVGRRVSLQRDPTQPNTDKYGRLLRYVTTADHRDVGRAQLEAGAADVFVVGRPFLRHDGYQVYERGAVAAGRGRWGRCR